MISLRSINTEGLDSWFDYADMLKMLAESIDKYINNFRDKLSPSERDTLRTFSAKIRGDGRTLATITAVDLLKQLDPQLKKLRGAIDQANNFLNDVNGTRSFITALSTVFDIATDIIRLVRPA